MDETGTSLIGSHIDPSIAVRQVVAARCRRQTQAVLEIQMGIIAAAAHQTAHPRGIDAEGSCKGDLRSEMLGRTVEAGRKVSEAIGAHTTHAAMRKLRARYPGARILVFERRGSLPIGFAPAQRGSAVFSIVVYPRWVRFFFLEGIALDDPRRRLEGTGNQVRSLRLDPGAALLDEPYVKQLMAQAVRIADADLTSGPGHIILKSKL